MGSNLLQCVMVLGCSSGYYVFALISQESPIRNDSDNHKNESVRVPN
jgi:hypothetical protein